MHQLKSYHDINILTWFLLLERSNPFPQLKNQFRRYMHYIKEIYPSQINVASTWLRFCRQISQLGMRLTSLHSYAPPSPAPPPHTHTHTHATPPHTHTHMPHPGVPARLDVYIDRVASKFDRQIGSAAVQMAVQPREWENTQVMIKYQFTQEWMAELILVENFIIGIHPPTSSISNYRYVPLLLYLRPI